MDELPKKMPPDDLATFDASAAAEADYDAWARAKIAGALKEAVDHPEKRVPLDEVWKRFGLEH
jgi:hypothetical protein